MKPMSFLLIALLSITSYTFAQNGLQDLVGARANSLDDSMIRKGFVHIKSSKSYDGIYSYYWKQQNTKCVTVHIEDGYVSSVTKTMPADCNQRGNANYSSHQNHQAHHRPNYQHFDNNQHSDYFERGYNDGLHNASYHNYSSDIEVQKAYIAGYEAGVKQRGVNMSHHSGGGGYGAHVKVGDLDGWMASSAYEEIQNRGYRFVKEYINDDKAKVKVWLNDRTRECKKTSEKHGKIIFVAGSKKCYQ